MQSTATQEQSAETHTAVVLPDNERLAKENRLASLFREQGADVEMEEINKDPALILASLETAVKETRAQQDELFAQKSSLFEKQRQVSEWTDSPEKQESLNLLSELLQEQTNRLAATIKQVELAESELATYRKSRTAAKYRVAPVTIPIDVTQPYHLTMQRWFKLSSVPVLPGTRDIDWKGLELRGAKNGPELDLAAGLKESTSKSLVIDPNEDPSTFVKRFQDLVEMAKVEDLGYHLSELIYQSLPAAGREHIDKEYPEGVHLLKDYKQLLSMLSRMPTAFHGTNTQPGAYIAERWASHALIRSYTEPRRFNTNKSSTPQSMKRIETPSSTFRGHESKGKEDKRSKLTCQEKTSSDKKVGAIRVSTKRARTDEEDHHLSQSFKRHARSESDSESDSESTHGLDEDCQ
ncbi:hypothetical protein FBU30_002516, partial [Linnemannia zychae]